MTARAKMTDIVRRIIDGADVTNAEIDAAIVDLKRETRRRSWDVMVARGKSYGEGGK